MNSSIFLELAKKSGLYHRLPNGNFYPTYLPAEECGETYNKFADLIIEDVRKIIHDLYNVLPLDQAVGLLTLDNHIKSHFGDN